MHGAMTSASVGISESGNVMDATLLKMTSHRRRIGGDRDRATGRLPL